VALAERAGLSALAGAYLSVPGGAGVAAGAKVAALVAGMVAGADSIADMDLLRHGGMGRLFDGVRAPSTLGTFLRVFRFGHVRQLDAVAARFTAGLARQAPIISAGEPVTYLDISDTIRATFGYAKQGAGYGYSCAKGLNALLATVSSASSAPVIVATRLRKGSANSAPGAARRHRTHFSITARKDRAWSPPSPDQRRRLDQDPLPARGLRRPAPAVDLRCRGRRDPVLPRSPRSPGLGRCRRG
jgi:hypothetical protein